MKQSHSKEDEIVKNLVLGVGVSVATNEQVLEFITRGLEGNNEKFYVVTPNPEILVIANKNSDYKKALNNAKIASIDGVGVLLAGKIMGKELGQRFTGVDLLEALCERVSKRPITVGFLGAGPGVAELTSECLREKYPELKVIFTHGGAADEATVGYINSEMLKNNSKKTIDLLFVAFGSPKQEQWIAKNLNKLPVKVAIGVGGSFDFISGRVKRAPRLFRNLGLEWLFRLLIQPWRIKRQLSLVTFLFLVLKKKFSTK
jgi:N-acetylglucosaminyldiphosphoundecaprenol N-acetyl-beta-D-mannosaminyltransferase